MVKEFAKKQRIGFYFDIHGHSNKKSATHFAPSLAILIK
jgi:hypothetical protein